MITIWVITFIAVIFVIIRRHLFRCTICGKFILPWQRDIEEDLLTHCHYKCACGGK